MTQDDRKPWSTKTPAEIMADFKAGWEQMERDAEKAPKRPPNFLAWELMTPQQIFDDLDASDFVFVLPPWISEKLREEWGGRLPKSVSVVKSVAATPEYEPLPERGPMPKVAVFDETTWFDGAKLRANGKPLNVEGVNITIIGGGLGTGRYDAGAFARAMNVREMTVSFSYFPEVSGDGYRKISAPHAEPDQNPHKAHLARGAQWKREKGRRR